MRSKILMFASGHALLAPAARPYAMDRNRRSPDRLVPSALQGATS